MRLKTLTLKNFRNLEDIEVNFKKDTTVLVGDNAQGKTNFLESVYFLATGKPIKTETDEETIKFGQESVNVEGLIQNKETEVKISTIIQKVSESLRKRFLVNGIPRRLLDYAGNLAAVFFRPEDIDLITGSPSVRREYMDRTISQTDRDYRKTLSSYQKVITQKNKLLKLIREGLAKVDELDFWNDQQLKLGTILQEKRKAFFESINSFERKFGDFEYKYSPNEISERRLMEISSREIPAAVCLIGPHRDDFIFYLEDKQSLRSKDLKQSLQSSDLKQSLQSNDLENGLGRGSLKDLAKFGSRGEQRTAVLDLKITELSYFENVLGERPVLLLDDIFSELDEGHRKHVLDLAKLQQTIIASVEYDDYLKEELKTGQILKVKAGVIES